MLKISVVIPIYNGEKYIEDAVLSVAKQPYKNIEIVCVDDGSTDNTLSVLKKLREDDSRIKILTQDNRGVSYSRNRGIEVAEGEYISFLDADDVWIPNAVDEKLIDKIMKSKCKMISFGYCYSDEKITRVKIEKREEKLVQNSCVVAGENYRPFCSYFYDRKYLTENNIGFAGKRNEDERFRMQCVFLGGSMLYVTNILFVYRNNPVSVTHQKTESVSKTISTIIKDYQELYVGTDNEKIKAYCNDTIIHLTLELLIALVYEGCCKKMDYYVEKINLKKYINQSGWMSESDKYNWQLYFNDKKKFIDYHRRKAQKEYLLRKLLNVKFLYKLYEDRKYPMKYEMFLEKLESAYEEG